MDKNENIRARLTANEVRKYRAMLRAKQSEILGNVVSMEHEALLRERSDLSNAPTHLADAGTDSFEIENTLGLMDSERRLLEQIDEALQRIEDGTYGICEGHGGLIPAKRLEAIPWTKYCVQCANLAEKGLAQRATSSARTNYSYSTNDEDDRNDGQLFWRLEKS